MCARFAWSCGWSRQASDGAVVLPRPTLLAPSTSRSGDDDPFTLALMGGRLRCSVAAGSAAASEPTLARRSCREARADPQGRAAVFAASRCRPPLRCPFQRLRGVASSSSACLSLRLTSVRCGMATSRFSRQGIGAALHLVEGRHHHRPLCAFSEAVAARRGASAAAAFALWVAACLLSLYERSPPAFRACVTLLVEVRDVDGQLLDLREARGAAVLDCCGDSRNHGHIF